MLDPNILFNNFSNIFSLYSSPVAVTELYTSKKERILRTWKLPLRPDLLNDIKNATKSVLWLYFYSPKVLVSTVSLKQTTICNNSISRCTSHSNENLCWLFHFFNPNWNLLRFMFFLALQLRATLRRSAWEQNTSLRARMWPSLRTSLRWRRGRSPCSGSMRRRRRLQYTWCDSWTGTVVMGVEVLASFCVLPSWAVNVVASLKLNINRVLTSRLEWWVTRVH